jgi:hypothetical protein
VACKKGETYLVNIAAETNYSLLFPLLEKVRLVTDNFMAFFAVYTSELTNRERWLSGFRLARVALFVALAISRPCLNVRKLCYLRAQCALLDHATC